MLRLAGLENLTGKVLLDASDPLDFSSGRPGLFVGTTDSLGERVQRLAPTAYVAKGLNTVLADVMVDPTLSGGDPDMFIAGNDENAKAVVTALLAEFGWPVTSKVRALNEAQTTDSGYGETGARGALWCPEGVSR